MFAKFLRISVIFSIAAISGCTGYDEEVAWPSARPLGRDINAYRPPIEPPTTAQDAPEVEEPNGVITMRQALASALMHNPELRAYSWEVRASEARTLQARLWPNPEIEVEMEEVGGGGGRSGFDGAETTIRLGQLIELAGKPSKRIRVATLGSKLAGWDYEAKRLDVLTSVAHAFVEVLAAQERLSLAEELVQLSNQVLNTVTQRVEAGKDSPVEKTKAQVTLASARIEQEQARRRLTSTRKRLAATWGSVSPVFASASGRLDVTFPVPPESELTHLLAENPDLARWAAEVERRRAALELEKAKAVPDITLSGGIQRFHETDDNALVFGLAIPVPLFNQNQGKILEAKYNLAKAENLQRAAETSLYTTLANAYQALASASIESTGLGNEIVPGAQRAFYAASQGYREGKFNYLMVLDAQRTFFYARAKYIESLAAYHKAKADVERLIGQDLNSIENRAGAEVKQSK